MHMPENWEALTRLSARFTRPLLPVQMARQHYQVLYVLKEMNQELG